MTESTWLFVQFFTVIVGIPAFACFALLAMQSR